MVQRDWQRHHQRQSVQNVDSANCQKGVRPYPQYELIEVLLHELQIENAKTNYDEKRGETEKLSDALTSASTILFTH